MTPLFNDPMVWMRSDRNLKLKDSDWTVMPDSPFDDAKRAEWVAYRSALRDVPANNTPSISDEGRLTGVNWPVPPND